MERTELEEGGDAMMGWTMVRSKGSNGQEEKEVMTREERRNDFKLKYPHLIRFWSDEEIEEWMEMREQGCEQEEKLKKRWKKF